MLRSRMIASGISRSISEETGDIAPLNSEISRCKVPIQRLVHSRRSRAPSTLRFMRSTVLRSSMVDGRWPVPIVCISLRSTASLAEVSSSSSLGTARRQCSTRSRSSQINVDLISLSASAMAIPMSSRNRISARRKSSRAATSEMFASLPIVYALFFFPG